MAPRADTQTARPTHTRHERHLEIYRGLAKSEKRRVAVLGGNRIPFARSDRAYAEASNQDMFTAALGGLVDRFGLAGEQLGVVVGGAVLKHSRDFNLMRECVLGSAAVPLHAGVRPAAGLRHRPAGRDRRGRRHRRRPLRRGRRRRGGHHLGRADRPGRRPAPHAAETAPVQVQHGAAQAGGHAAGHPRHRDPGQQRAAHRPVDGRARRHHRQANGDQARRPGRAGRRQPSQHGRRLRSRLLRRPGHAVSGAVPRRQSAARLPASRNWPGCDRFSGSRPATRR